jgi:hypothetical protein
VQPYLGVGALRFGQTLAQVRRILKGYEPEDESRDKSGGVVTIKLYYESFDLIVGADGKGVVEYFEFFHAPQIEPTVTFDGVALLRRSYDALLDDFRSRDPETEPRDDIGGFRSLKLGVIVAQPCLESEDRPEHVHLFRRGYHDEE